MKKSTQIFTILKYKKKNYQFICLSVILIDSVFRTDKNYYPQMFWEECKYVAKEKKMPQHDCMFLSCHVGVSEWIHTL